MTTQSRVPGGSAAGGQFAPMFRAEPPPLSLAATGSYRFPPVIRDLEEFEQFWSTVEVDDDVCRAFQSNYNRHWREVAVEKVLEWDAKNPKPTSGRGYEQRLQQWSQAREMVSAQAKAQTPPLYGDQVRPLARIRAMVSCSVQLPEEDREKLLSRQVSLSGAEPGTVASVADRYHLRAIHALWDIDERERELRTMNALESIRKSTGDLDARVQWGG